ncbi:MAG: YceI family protein, partial [Acidimicrobiales bacterium]
MTITQTPTTTALALVPGRWTLDPNHSAVVFSVRHLGLSKVRGTFQRFDATLEVGPALDDVKVEAVIDMASVNTNNADRDAHLRSTDFFGVEANPTMRFQSGRITETADGYRMAGELSINGTTRPIELPVEFNGLERFQGTELHAGFAAQGELRRSEFGIDFGILPLGGDKLA